MFHCFALKPAEFHRNLVVGEFASLPNTVRCSGLRSPFIRANLQFRGARGADGARGCLLLGSSAHKPRSRRQNLSANLSPVLQFPSNCMPKCANKGP